MKKIGIVMTMGDPAGIGPEVLVEAHNILRGRFKDAAFFIAGDQAVLSYYGWRKSSNTVVLDEALLARGRWQPGRATAQTACAGFAYLKRASVLLRQGIAQGIVTAPISKENIQKAGFSWPGHTEFLAEMAGAKNVEMCFISDRLKVALVTRHVSLADAIRSVRCERILACGRTVEDLLCKNFKIRRPRIAVCGLNPHAGEKGLFGDQELTEIRPAITKLNRSGRGLFIGPLPADTVFHQALAGAYDLVLAMYHDQGLIPFKTVSFDRGVNLTAGLPFVRTSPVHGTAFDIAGLGKANPSSMSAAIELAVKLSRNFAR